MTKSDGAFVKSSTEVNDIIAHLREQMRTRDPPTDWRTSMPRISKDQAAAIGYIASEWAIAQVWQVEIIHLMLSAAGDAGHAVTAELTELQRMAMIRSLLENARNQEWLDEWDAISRISDDLRNKRNDVIHSEWAVSGENKHYMFRVGAKDRVSVRTNVVSTDELNSLSESIIDLINCLIKFFYLLLKFGGYGIATVISKEPRLVPGQGRAARAQAQARVQKRAQKEAHRAASRKIPGTPN